MFACMWDYCRKGWECRSVATAGQPSASGLFRSNDGGETGQRLLLEANKGFPEEAIWPARDCDRAFKPQTGLLFG